MAGCNQEWFENLSAWHDGEVTDNDAARIAAHVADCAACHRAAEMLGHTRAAFAASSATEVPDAVRERAAAALARPATSHARRWVWRGLAAAGVAAAAAVMFALPHRELPSNVEDELVNHHLVGFARERPCDFESSDPAAVAAWFEKELGYPVEVTVPAGARLLGARLCKLEGARTAAVMLVSGDDQKPLTVFVPRRDSPAALAARDYAGEGVRCTTGPLGKAICVKGAERPLLAVAEIGPAALASSLETVR